MTVHWKELLPIDEYMVRTNGILHEYDRKVLTMLYLPLIGSTCYSLYMALWSEVEANRFWSEEKKHLHLMSMLQLNLQQIFEERKKLEGIGLLKTYVNNGDAMRTYIYELQPPLSPKNFFDDGVLNIYLYNRLGKKSFNKMKQFFSDTKVDTNTFKDVTSTFSETFSSVNPSELYTSNEEMAEALNIKDDEQYANREKTYGILLSEQQFDFSLFFAGISEVLIPHEAFSKEVKEVITKLAFVYHIDPIEMKKVVIQALDENDQINIEALRKAARDYYQLENGDALPKLVEKVQPIHLRTMNTAEPINKEEQLTKQLEQISPYQLLVDISGGVEPALSDLKIIENIMINQKLNAGVVNVLIYYVMLRSDMKLSKNYMEKLASHWARKQIKTVKEAMELARDEHRQYQEWAESKKNSSKTKKQTAKSNATPEQKRRLLMLGLDESEMSRNSISQEMTEEERMKRKQKMLDLLEGKGDEQH